MVLCVKGADGTDGVHSLTMLGDGVGFTRSILMPLVLSHISQMPGFRWW